MTKLKLDATAEYISNWLKKQMMNAKAESLVVGVSGGVDSAVVSALSAMTNKPLHVISMPIHQNPDHLTRADDHIKWLQTKFPNVEGHTVDLSQAFDNCMATLPEVVRNNELAGANTRSRLRMIALYAMANSVNGLVVGTGNKVEDFGVGFFTKYGDGGVDVSPIGSLLKTDVWAMAKHLEVIDSIVSAPPSDGLWGDSRSDEAQIGASYEELEWAMEFDEKNPELAHNLTDRQKQVYQIYVERHNRNAHKMNMPPVCQLPSNLFSEV